MAITDDITHVSLPDLPPKLKVLAVTKGRSILEIRSMLEETGLKKIGENRLEEAQKKFPELPKNLEKHFIGKLQSRKIKALVELFDVLETVENEEQAQIINRYAGQLRKNMVIFIEVNISKLPQRGGISPEEVPVLIEKIKKLPHLTLQGVMGLASHDPEKVRQEFKRLKSLQGPLPDCSMGMSEDYRIAIEEGSTQIRLGRLLFNDLPKP